MRIPSPFHYRTRVNFLSVSCSCDNGSKSGDGSSDSGNDWNQIKTQHGGCFLVGSVASLPGGRAEWLAACLNNGNWLTVAVAEISKVQWRHRLTFHLISPFGKHHCLLFTSSAPVNCTLLFPPPPCSEDIRHRRLGALRPVCSPVLPPPPPPPSEAPGLHNSHNWGGGGDQGRHGEPAESSHLKWKGSRGNGSTLSTLSAEYVMSKRECRRHL